MTRLHLRPLFSAVAAVLLLASASAALAGEDPNRNRAAVPGPTIGGTATANSPDGVGARRTATWVDATKFGGRSASTAPQLTFWAQNYYNAPGATSNQGYFAPVELEPGVLVDGITCVYDNGSATNNVGGSFQKNSTDFNSVPPARNGTSLASWSGTANEGVAYKFTPLSAPETISYTDGGNLLNTYHLRVDVAQDTSFAGCLVWWTRQISPAPATASFTDVPTNYWAFQYIEALKASGITQGVTPTTFQPESNVTRAQMAVFMAKALGLYWAY